MFPEPTEPLLIGHLIESIWNPKSKSNTLTPKTNSQTYWPREFHTWWMESSFVFNISHFSSTDCSEVMLKRTQKDSGEERVTAKSRPMMNMVSRCSARAPDALASTPSERLVKPRHENQNASELATEQHRRTGRLVENAYSSSYSEWNVDQNWSSQKWKSDELMEVSTGRPVLFAQHTDKFIVENGKMNSYTDAVNTIHPAPEIHEHFMIQKATEHCVQFHPQSQQRGAQCDQLRNNMTHTDEMIA